MLISMTGYGRATGTVCNQTIKVEIKSVNSKFTEYRFRLPNFLKEKEFEFRKLLNGSIDRGKIDFLIELASTDSEEILINKKLFKKYAVVLKDLAYETGLKEDSLISGILSIPEVIQSPETDLNEEDWSAAEATVRKAIEDFNVFRQHEGLILADVIKVNVNNILSLLHKVAPFESNRMETVKQRLNKMMSDYSNRTEYDPNRFEQELLYYIEKMDFTEEKVRLDKHCNFFLEKLALPVSNGRELNFISQEMGREINTLGSKAQDHQIQHIVVAMKDELEKIKEQLANVV